MPARANCPYTPGTVHARVSCVTGTPECPPWKSTDWLRRESTGGGGRAGLKQGGQFATTALTHGLFLKLLHPHGEGLLQLARGLDEHFGLVAG